MLATRQAGALQELGLRVLPNLRDLLLPCLSRSFATHGVAEGGSAQGVPRFYKTVHVRDALDQVRG